MKHTEVLKRAWYTMLHYRALWIFGIILALTATSSAATMIPAAHHVPGGAW
jgi:hypothetical protein